MGKRRRMIQNPMVRRVLLLALAAAVMLAVATVALAGPNDPQLHKRPADVTRAKTLIMSLRDLPSGFVDKGPVKNQSSTTPPGCSEPNLHALVMTADVSSHKFVRTRAGSYAEVASEASFFLSPAQAQTAVAAVTTSKIGRCLKEAVIEGAKKSSGGAMTIVSAHVVPLSESVADMHDKFWDVLVTFKAHGLVFRDELVLAYLRRGRVVSNLVLNSLNGLTESEAQSISERLTRRLALLPKSVVG
jgi:hypothetical protein